MADIRIENLRKEFGSFVAVEDSSFTVHDGEFWRCSGPPAVARRRHFA